MRRRSRKHVMKGVILIITGMIFILYFQLSNVKYSESDIGLHEKQHVSFRNDRFFTGNESKVKESVDKTKLIRGQNINFSLPYKVRIKENQYTENIENENKDHVAILIVNNNTDNRYLHSQSKYELAEKDSPTIKDEKKSESITTDNSLAGNSRRISEKPNPTLQEINEAEFAGRFWYSRDNHIKKTNANEEEISLNLLNSEEDNNEDLQQDERGSKLKDRLQHLQEVCDQYGVHEGNSDNVSWTNHFFNDGGETGHFEEHILLSNFQLARSASTMTCLINKVASTSLAVSLLKAEGWEMPPKDQEEEVSPHGAVAVLQPQTMAEFNFTRKHFFKFLLVRHPFERLLSAYRDKVERAQHWSLARLRQHIQETVKETKAEVPSSPSFCEGVADVPIMSTVKVNDIIENVTVPSFSDFLEFILSPASEASGEFARHWSPYWSQCCPCSINYDVIVKLENSHVDLQKVWYRTGLSGSDVPWYNGSGREASSKQQVLSKYYSSVEPRLLARLYRHFHLDFLLFQYDPLEVFRLGGHCQIQDCSDMQRLMECFLK